MKKYIFLLIVHGFEDSFGSPNKQILKNWDTALISPDSPQQAVSKILQILGSLFFSAFLITHVSRCVKGRILQQSSWKIDHLDRHIKGRGQPKKTFSFGHCPNYLDPPTMTPIRATLSSFFRSQNSRFESQFKTKNTIYTI